MRQGKDDQPVGVSTGTEASAAPSLKRIVVNGVVVVTVCAMIAACGSSPTKKSSKSRSKEYFSEKKYGVKASPRVAQAGKPVRKGGGRYLVGKPYKVAGKWYRPRANKNYKKSGYASWYGAAFHGRLTANGEVYDMNGLSAAHPTLPLPSYVRVTNLRNRRSVIVRVNDRGPFHGNRVIDLSKRTAELLDFKKNGVAKVRVRYVGRAPLHGRDHAQLMASYRGPGRPAPGGTMPGTMLASADEPDSALVGASFRLAGTRPQSRPYNVAPAPVAVAYDPAAAYGDGAGSVMIAALDGQPAESGAASRTDADVTAATGTYDPDIPAREIAAETDATRVAPQVRTVRTVAVRLPDDAALAARPAAPPVRRVETRPVRTVAPRPPAPATSAASRGPVPPGAIPTAAAGGEAPISGLGGPFVMLPESGARSVSAGALFYQTEHRVAAGHQVIASLADDAVPLRALHARIAARTNRAAPPRGVVIRLGLFRDGGNIEKLARKLAAVGRIESRPVTVKGAPMTMVSLTALAPGMSAEDAIRAAERAGAHGAFRVK